MVGFFVITSSRKTTVIFLFLAYCWGHAYNYGTDESLNALTGGSRLGDGVGANRTSLTPVVSSKVSDADRVIDDVTFSQVEGKNIMTIRGENLAGNNHHDQGLNGRSLVTLNGISLQYCTDNLGIPPEYAGNISPEQVLGAYGFTSGYADSPPCYYLTQYKKSPSWFFSPDFTASEFRVQVPGDFDTTAPGVISVNGSPIYTFNSNDDEEALTPEVYVGNHTSLESKPTIFKRPTFYGTAQPGATVTVTVHSDPVICTTTADADGNWSCTLPTDLEPGNHTVYVRITNPDNSVIELGPYAVIVNGPATTLTNTTPGVPSTGIGRATNAWIAGVYLAGAMGLSIGALAWCYGSYRRSR